MGEDAPHSGSADRSSLTERPASARRHGGLEVALSLAPGRSGPKIPKIPKIPTGPKKLTGQRILTAFLTPDRLEALGRAFWVAVIPGAILFVALQTIGYARAGMIGADSHAYWAAVRLPQTRYTQPPGYRDAYLYSPAFAQLLWPLGQLPWPAFQSVWMAAQVGVLGWLLAPLGWRRGLTLAPFLVAEILLGNVYLFFAGALVVSLGRAPGALALPALTKVAPAVVGLWFVVRRQWRGALYAAGITALIVAISIATAPSEWLAWANFLLHSAGQRGVTSTLRFVAAIGMVVWAARTGRAWLLAPAMLLSCPVLGGYGALAVLAAIPRLVQFERDERSARSARTVPAMG